MVLAVVVNEERNGAWESSGSVLPFGVFDNEEMAQKLFDEEKQKKDSYFSENDVLMVKEVELNKPVIVTNDNWKDLVFLSYWFCE